jgi:hypothetical protein
MKYKGDQSVRALSINWEMWGGIVTWTGTHWNQVCRNQSHIRSAIVRTYVVINVVISVVIKHIRLMRKVLHTSLSIQSLKDMEVAPSLHF